MLTAEHLIAVVDENPRIRGITKEHYRDAITRWVAFAGETSAAWSTRTAQTFYNHLIDPKDGGLKPQSANTILYGLRYAFRRLALLEQDPNVDIMRAVINLPDAEPERARVLSEDEAHRLCDARRAKPKIINARHLRDFAFIVLGLQTGMRRMSFASIKIDRIERSMIRGVALKGGKRYDVPLSRTAHAALQPYLRWLKSQGVDSGLLFRRIDPTLHPTTGLTIRGIDELVQRLSADAEVPDISLHTFRHTFITWAREAGAEPYAIANITGHATEASVGGRAGVIEDVYTDRKRSGTKAADLIAKPWMLP